MTDQQFLEMLAAHIVTKLEKNFNRSSGRTAYNWSLNVILKAQTFLT